MNYKVIIGILATILAFVSYIPYFRSLIAGKTKPHVFSWIVWTTISGIIFVAQVTHGAGAGAWANGLTTACSIIIVCFAFIHGEKHITILDWVCFAGALLALLFWIFMKEPTISVILAVMTDILAFVPTVRKTLRRPHEETMTLFALAGIKHALMLAALEHVTFITAFHSFYLVIANTLFVSAVLLRRKSKGMEVHP